MTRRDFRTPPSLPEETQVRCITIPASQQWLGLVNAALLMLTEAWRYEQVEDTDLTADETAAAAYAMYVAYLGVCDVACCPMRINPFNGRLQQSDDDGLTWFDVSDGPWTESLYPEFSAMPAPRTEPTDAEKECAAAATGAYVLANLYQQTGNTLLNAVAETDWEYAGALGAMLQGFLMMIGAAAVQPFVAIASLLGIVGVKQQYVDNPLDSDDEERLTCILLENATLQPSGAVTFDFQAVWDAIDLDSPKNGLVRFLLTMIGPDALNYAGAIDAGITPDCAPCGTWCYEFDFQTDTDKLGWERYIMWEGSICNDLPMALWTGSGWAEQRCSVGTQTFDGITICSPAFTGILTEVEYTMSPTPTGSNPVTTLAAVADNDDGAGTVFKTQAGQGATVTVTGFSRGFSGNCLKMQFDPAQGSIQATSAVIRKVTLRGTGDNPFGSDNC